ncbi:MAG: hypothetical protein AAGH83_08860 [Pseudomonadota bacterium]
MRFLSVTALAVVAFPVVAQADPLKEVISAALPLEEPPFEWMGETPHFVMMGTVDGYTFNVQVTDVEAADNLSKFTAKREYKADGSGYRYVEFKIDLESVIGGIEREIELDFQNHDFLSFQDVATLQLGSTKYPQGEAAYFELEFEWDSQGTSVDEEIDDWQGVLILHHDEGETDDKGLSGTGEIGALVQATRGSDTMIISFSAPVVDYDVDD